MSGKNYSAATPWLCVAGYGNWQRHKKPSPAWLAIDCGLVSDPRKRAVWEPQGAAGFLLWHELLVAVGKASPQGLIWGDPEMLRRSLGRPAMPDIGWLVAAGWVVYLSDEEKAFIEGGGKVAELTAAAAETTQRDEVFAALAAALTDRYGEPSTSRRSAARYWRPAGRPGPQIRLAFHKARRAKDTVCDVVLGHPDSDIVVPLDRPVDAAWVAGQVDRWVQGAVDPCAQETPKAGETARKENDFQAKNADPCAQGTPKAGAGAHVQPASRAKKADPCAQCAPENKPNARKKPASQSKNGDLVACAQNTGQDKTGQDRTGQEKTAPCSTGDPQRERALPGCDRTGPVPGGDRGRSGREPPGKGPGDPEKPEDGVGRRLPDRPRSGGGADPTSLREAIKLIWQDREAIAFGTDVFDIIWPGRHAGSDDAKSEIGAFAMLWGEVKAQLPSKWWPAAREKGLAKARHVHRYSLKARKPGAIFTKRFRESLAKMAKGAS